MEIHSRKPRAAPPENSRGPKEENSLPNIIFEGRAVSFREATSEQKQEVTAL